MTKPPGWYPDPSHTGHGTAPERWWDGSAWTGRTRAGDSAAESGTAPPSASASAPEAVADLPTLPGGHPLPAGRPAPPRRRRAVAAAAGGALLAGALLGGFLLWQGGSGSDAASDAGADAPPEAGRAEPEEAPPADPAPTGDAAPEPAASLTEARVGGAALPVLPGWAETTGAGAAATLSPYPCPGDRSLRCVAGGAFLTPATEGTDARTAAEADIPRHAADAYDQPAYGGVTGAEEVLAEPVSVAGEDGYRVRHHLTTGEGIDAYVESVAFPAPDGSGSLLVLRLGFDADTGAEPPAEMDAIVAGVREVSGGPGTGE